MAVQTQEIKIDEAVFNLRKLSGRDMAALNKAERAIDIDGMAQVLAKVTLSIPGMDDVSNADAFADLPFVDLMKLLKGLGQSVAGELQR